MNRRGFLEAMLKAGVAAAVLPAATTYARRWVKPAGKQIIVGYWHQTTRAAFAMDESFVCKLSDVLPTTTLHAMTRVLPQKQADELLKRYPMPKVVIIENVEVSDGGPLTHESPAAQSRRSLH